MRARRPVYRMPERPPVAIKQSTEEIFMQKLSHALSTLNMLGQKRLTTASTFAVEAASDPWPGLILVRVLESGETGRVTEPLGRDDMLAFIAGLSFGLRIAGQKL